MRDTEFYEALLGLRDPWRVTKVELNSSAGRVDVWVEDRSGVKWNCLECQKKASVYDHSEQRVWRHLNTCQYGTYIHARLPRIKCSEHGVKQVSAPWAEPGSRFTLLYENRVIDTLKECDVTGANRLTGTSWYEAWNIMEKAVARGLNRKTSLVPDYLGIDEKAFAKRHRYETLVCDLSSGTVECVLEDRGQDCLEGYYGQFSKDELAGIKAIAMDMWDPYIAATKDLVPDAETKIVFDRFHVIGQVTNALDKVRRQEHKMLMAKGQECLKGTKHLWLMNEERIPDWRKGEFDEIRKMKLKTGRAWAIKESLRHFWDYSYPKNAEKYFKRWYFWATHSRLKPMIKAAKTLKRHLPNILTYFKHHITNAVTEGLNSKIQTVKQMACGFRNREHYRKAILFHCGGLDLYARASSQTGASLDTTICGMAHAKL
ncbi:MAG: ISL3 family transposase [Deltaproteobacteria bacterium]|nr:ISL3 family transposase [Deltaproteobacteria bacterium]